MTKLAVIMGTYQDSRAAIVRGATVSSRLGFFSTLVLLGIALPTWAAAQEWVKLPAKAQEVSVEGHQVKIVIRPEIRFTDGPGNTIIANLRARARLDDLQDKAPAVLQAVAEKKSTCETRWSFPSLAPIAVQDGKLKIGGQIRVVQWACVGPLKTIVASETADFIVALHPINRETEVVVAAELEKLDLGGGLLRTLGASDEVRNMVAGLLNKGFGGEDTKLKFPPEIASINPKFTNTGISDAGSGKGELFMEAQATIGAGDMTRIMSLVAK